MSPGGARPGVPHRPAGTGSLSRSVDRNGRVTYRGQITRDGQRYLARGVTVRRGVSDAAARRLADANLRALIAELDAGEVPDRQKARVTLAQWCDDWLTAKKRTLPAETSSWEQYEQVTRLSIVPYLGHYRLIALRQTHILAWREWLLTTPVWRGQIDPMDEPRAKPRPPRYVKLAETILRAILRDALGADYRVSPTLFALPHVDVPDTAERPYLTAAQFVRLTDAAPEPWRTFWTVSYYAGLRVQEAIGLTWRQVDPFRGGVLVDTQRDRYTHAPRAPKRGSIGFVPLPASVLAALAAHREGQEAATGRAVRPDDLVFPHRAGAPYTYEFVVRTLRRHLAAAGLDATMGTHALRHGAAMVRVDIDTPLVRLREQMRHRKIETTMRYLHPTQEGGSEDAEQVAKRVDQARKRGS